MPAPKLTVPTPVPVLSARSVTAAPPVLVRSPLIAMLR